MKASSLTRPAKHITSLFFTHQTKNTEASLVEHL